MFILRQYAYMYKELMADIEDTKTDFFGKKEQGLG